MNTYVRMVMKKYCSNLKRTVGHELLYIPIRSFFSSSQFKHKKPTVVRTEIVTSTVNFKILAMGSYLLFLCVGYLFVCTTSVNAVTMFVTANGDDNNDGLSLSKGKRTVNGALSSGRADRVVLGAGVFVASKPIKFGEDVPWVPNLSIIGQVLHARAL